MSYLDCIGDEQALRLELARLKRVAARCISPGEAEEVALETVAVMWDRISHDVHMDHPRAYATAVALNLARSAQRREMRVCAAADDDGLVTSVDVQLEAMASRGAHIKALLTLSDRQRVITYLRYYEDLTPAEIAEILDTTPSAVTSCLHRARKALEAQLGGDDR